MLGMQSHSHSHSQLNHHVPNYQPINSSLESPSPRPLSRTLPIPSLQASSSTARPKLSLNTTINNTQPRTFGKGSSLRIDCLTATTPTIVNTFSNAYHRENGQQNNDHHEQPSATSSTSTSSSSTIPEATTCPYTQHAHIKSILSNGHFTKPNIKRLSLQRPLFPVARTVSFKDPLSEDIVTSKFTLAHSDIVDFINTDLNRNDEKSTATDVSTATSSLDRNTPVTTPIQEASTCTTSTTSASSRTSSSTPILTATATPIPTFTSTTTPTVPRLGSPTNSPRPSHHRRQNSLSLSVSLLSTSSYSSSPSPSTSTSTSISISPPTSTSSSPTAFKGHKRDSSTSESESEDGPVPQTPVAGRCKRRKWQWTLGPIAGYEGPTCGGSDEDGDDNDYNGGNSKTNNHNNVNETPHGSREGSVDCVGRSHDDSIILMSPNTTGPSIEI